MKGRAMGLAGYGKIDDKDGLRQAFQQLLGAHQYECGLVRITGQTAGLITLRQGQYISGALVKGSGATGVAALKELFGVSQGLYSYMGAEKLPDDVKIEQPLMVDIAALLNSGDSSLLTALDTLFQQQQTGIGVTQPAGADGWAIDLPPVRRNTAPPPAQTLAHSTPQPANYSNNAQLGKSESANAISANAIKDELTIDLFLPQGAELFPAQEALNPVQQSPFGIAAPPTPAIPPAPAVAPQTAALSTPPTPQAVPQAGPTPGVQSQNERILPQAADLQKFKQSQELHNFRQAQQQQFARSGETALNNDTPRSRTAAPDGVPGSWTQPDMPAPPIQANWATPATSRAPIQLEQPASAPLLTDPPPSDRTSLRKKTSDFEALEKTKRTGEILQNAQRLRTTEIVTAVATEKQKKHSLKHLLDRGTITGATIVLVLSAMIFFYINNSNPQAGVVALIEQGKKELAIDKFDAARIQFTLALEKKPNDPEILLLRARAYEGDGDLALALADYDQVLKLKPADIDVLNKAAWAQYRCEHFDAAVADCDKALASKPQDDTALTIKIMALARAGSAKNASELAKSAAPNIHVPADLAPSFNADLGFAYMSLKQPTLAIEHYSKGLAITPNEWKMLIERAQCYMQTGKIKEAMADLHKAKNIRKSDPVAYRLLGDCLVTSQDYATAVKAYDNAAKHIPKPADIYLKIGRCYFNLQKYGDTERACEMVLALVPNDKAAINLKTMAMEKARSAKPLLIGDRSVFYEKEKPALNMTPMGMQPMGMGVPLGIQAAKSGEPDPLVALGYNALHNGDVEKASRLLARAVSKDGTNYFARTLLGHSLLKRGDPRHAYEEFEIANQHGVLTQADQVAFGHAATQIGRSDKAAEIFARCVQADPTSVESRVALIKAYIAIGDTARASEITQAGCKLFPQHADAFRAAAAGSSPRR